MKKRKKKNVLMIIDMQKGLLKEHPFQEELLIFNIKHLLEEARKQEIEVIYVCHDGGEGDDLEKGTKGFEILEEIKPREGECIFVKERNSSFYNTGLKEYLNQKLITEITVCGLQTDFCIDATVKAGFEHGFNMMVPQNGTSTFDNTYLSAEKTISYYEQYIWNRRYGFVTTVAEICNQWKEDEI